VCSISSGFIFILSRLELSPPGARLEPKFGGLIEAIQAANSEVQKIFNQTANFPVSVPMSANKVPACLGKERSLRPRRASPCAGRRPFAPIKGTICFAAVRKATRYARSCRRGHAARGSKPGACAAESQKPASTMPATSRSLGRSPRISEIC
jgi:hypothetical protein